MDNSDQAERLEQQQRDLSLKYIRTQPEVRYTGRCHNCAEPIEAPKRWCDVDCRDDWQQRQRRKR